jgi:hypothetical protein
MRASRIALLQFAAAGFVFLAGLAFAPASHAQMDPMGTVGSKPLKTKPIWLKAQVIHVNQDSIVVRESDHPMIVHTFTFSTKMAEVMEKVRSEGGFQRGDEVRIEHEPGKDEALTIRGRPSKSN